MRRKNRRNRKKFNIVDTDSISNFILSPEAARKRRQVKNILITVIVFVAVLGIYLLNVYKTYDDYKVRKSIAVESSSNSRYAAFGDFVIKYNNDGISYIDGKEIIWNDAYEMKSPIVDICDSYLAIADKNTNTIHIYNEEGKQGQVTTSYPIVKLEVAKQGVVAALLEEDKANYIEVYDREGNKLVQHKSLLDENGYPLSFSVSDDGKKMIVSYVSIQNGATENKVMFYDFANVGKDEIDRVVGTFSQYDDTIVPTVSFVTEDDAIAVGDNMFSVYRMKGKPVLKREVKVTDEIQKVFYNEKYIGFVFANENSDNPYRVEVYNLAGRKVMSTDIEMVFDKVTFAGKNVLLYNDMTCQIISLKGVTKFKYTFTEEINEIVPMSGRFSYLVMTNNKIEKIKLK